MDRVDLAAVEHTVHRWWERGQHGEPDHAVVGYGQLASGEWFVARLGRGWGGAWIAAYERQACDKVSSWMQRRGGVTAWRESTPAA